MIKRMTQALSACFLILAAFASPTLAISLPGGLTIEKTVLPNGSASGSIVILNNETAAETVRIYQTDYTFNADGKNEFGKPGSIARSCANWITLSSNQIVVPPKGSAEISYKISVPDNESLRGTYWSVIMAEPVPDASLTPPSPEKGKASIGVQAVFRHAVQVIVNIGDTGVKALEFTSKKLKSEKGKTFLIIDAKNTGERWLVPDLYVDLFDRNGQAKRCHGGKFRIYPGCSVRYTVDLGQLGRGTYNALVVADAGEENVFGAKYILEVK